MKQNNCQGCGCINEDQCICMKEEYTMHHPAGVDITFNSWEEYNKYMVYENKVRKEYCDQAYETGIKDVVALKQKSGITNSLIYEAGVEDGMEKVREEQMKKTYTYLHKSGVTIVFDKWEDYNTSFVYDEKIKKEVYAEAYKKGYSDCMVEVTTGQTKFNKDKSQSSREIMAKK